MNIKRILSILLVFVMCFSLTFCAEAEPSETEGNETSEAIEVTSDDASKETEESNQSEPEDTTEVIPDEKESSEVTPLLYKVSDGNGGVVWLFGSIHVGREEYYPLPDYVIDAFEKSDALAVEADILTFEQDVSLQVNALANFIYRDGSKITDHIPEELYNKAVEVLNKYNSFTPFLNMYKPAMWGSMIESLIYEECGAKTDLGIDRHLMERAIEAEKEILEVESIDFQYKMFGGFSDELQVMILEETVSSCDDLETLKNEINDLMDLWASGNEEEFSKYLQADAGEMTDEEKKLYEEPVVCDLNPVDTETNENYTVCRCNNVKYFDILNAASDHKDLSSLLAIFDEVKNTTHCSSGCGGCYNKVLTIISEMLSGNLR